MHPQIRKNEPGRLSGFAGMDPNSKFLRIKIRKKTADCDRMVAKNSNALANVQTRNSQVKGKCDKSKIRLTGKILPPDGSELYFANCASVW